MDIKKFIGIRNTSTGLVYPLLCDYNKGKAYRCFKCDWERFFWMKYDATYHVPCLCCSWKIKVFCLGISEWNVPTGVKSKLVQKPISEVASNKFHHRKDSSSEDKIKAANGKYKSFEFSSPEKSKLLKNKN